MADCQTAVFWWGRGPGASRWLQALRSRHTPSSAAGAQGDGDSDCFVEFKLAIQVAGAIGGALDGRPTALRKASIAFHPASASYQCVLSESVAE